MVRFRARTILVVLLLVIVVGTLLEVIWIARHVVTWIFIALFLTLALNPLVVWFQNHGVPRRSAASAAAFLLTLLALVAIGALFIPTLVHQVNQFAEAVPGYVHDLTKGKGRFGFLETRYHVVEKVREAVKSGGASKVLGLSGAALAVTKSVITIVVGTVTVAFMTFFMLLEGPIWVERFYEHLPAKSAKRWRAVGNDIYRAVGGYVTGNLLISLIAGSATTVVLLVMGVPYAVALGLVVAIFDLIPLAGATIAAIIVGTVAVLHSIVAGVVVIVFFVVYQQIENHFLQPVVYGRTVQLSPLTVLISVLIGAELAGVIGALAAIPVAGAFQVLIRDWLAHRKLSAANEPLA